MQARDLLNYCALATIWGLSFLVLVRVVSAFGWIAAISFRCILAGLTLYVLARALRRPLDLSKRLPSLAIVGATTVAGQLIGLTYATPKIGTSMASILVATIPLFSMMISQLWGLERMNARALLGLALGTTGIAVLVGFPSVPITPEFIIGCAAALFGNFCAAFGSNYASYKLKNVDAWTITMVAFFLGGLMVMPFLIVVPVPTVPNRSDYMNLIILGGIMSALAYIIYFRLVARIGATRAISVEFIVPIIASAAGKIYLNEHLTPFQFGGAALIILGCALVLQLQPIGQPRS